MFDVDECVAFITNRVAKKLSEEFNERLMTLGITRVQWIAMYYLLKHGRLSQTDLADKMDIKDSTVVRLVDRMEKEHFLIRTKDTQDRRITYLSLSEQGHTRIEELLPEGEAMSRIFSQGISDEEFAVFKTVLDKMVKNIDKTTRK
ncbi:Transcriptional regulator SlyA [Sporomusa rhizae]|uniref:MarR family winged helix-turn-helix transcriptional regulator n=1 Tax=Sporomusa rhizae TaxID=357999 RepID=UPI00352B185B